MKFSFAVSGFLPANDLHFWVNDGLMTLFFLLVGLEIRREMHDGTLSDPKVATLPLIAAGGGILVPALLYLVINSDPAARRLGDPDRDRHRVRAGHAVAHGKFSGRGWAGLVEVATVQCVVHVA